MRFPKACLAVAFVAGCGYTAAAPAGGEGCDGGSSKPSSVECSVSVPAVHFDGPEIAGLDKLTEGVKLTTDGVTSVNAVAVVALVSETSVKSLFVPNGVCTEVEVVEVTKVIVSSTVPAVVKATVYESMKDCESKSGGSSVAEDGKVSDDDSSASASGKIIGSYFNAPKAFSVGAVYVEVSAPSASGFIAPGIDVTTRSDIDFSSETKVDTTVSVSSNVDV